MVSLKIVTAMIGCRGRVELTICPASERPQDMSPSQPCHRLLRLYLLLLLAGLVGCGPASSDNVPGVESRGSGEEVF